MGHYDTVSNTGLEPGLNVGHLPHDVGRTVRQGGRVLLVAETGTAVPAVKNAQTFVELRVTSGHVWRY